MDLGIVGRSQPQSIDLEKFNKLYEDTIFHNKHSLDKPTTSFSEMQKCQMELRENFRQELETAAKLSDSDFKVRCQRGLEKLAELNKIQINKEALADLFKNHNSKEIIDFLIESRKEYDDRIYTDLSKLNIGKGDADFADSSIKEQLDPISMLDKNVYDSKLLDSTTDKILSKKDISVQIKFEDMLLNPPKEDIGKEVFSSTAESNKRTFEESSSSDSGDSPSMPPAASKKQK